MKSFLGPIWQQLDNSDFNDSVCCNIVSGGFQVKERHWTVVALQIEPLPIGRTSSSERAACAEALISYTVFFVAAHLAFISSDKRFFAAALMGLRPVAFLAGAAGFLGADLPPHFAQRCFIAAEIRLRAAGLIVRLRGVGGGAGAACFALGGAGCGTCTLGGRPRRAGWELSPTRAAIAFSIRLASCLSCATML